MVEQFNQYSSGCWCGCGKMDIL